MENGDPRANFGFQLFVTMWRSMELFHSYVTFNGTFFQYYVTFHGTSFESYSVLCDVPWYFFHYYATFHGTFFSIMWHSMVLFSVLCDVPWYFFQYYVTFHGAFFSIMWHSMVLFSVLCDVPWYFFSIMWHSMVLISVLCGIPWYFFQYYVTFHGTFYSSMRCSMAPIRPVSCDVPWDLFPVLCNMRSAALLTRSVWIEHLVSSWRARNLTLFPLCFFNSLIKITTTTPDQVLRKSIFFRKWPLHAYFQ